MAFRLAIDFSNCTTEKVSAKLIKRYLINVLRCLEGTDKLNIVVNKRPLGNEAIAIEVVITEEDEIKKLNKQYFQQDQPTDVLSFTYPKEAGIAGSVVICAPVARRQANEGGIALQDEINTLAGHGLLHLLGYNHR